MAKQKKKRTKAYSGADARTRRPTINRISAEDRGPVKDWWVNHRRMVRPALIIAGIVAALALLVVGLISLLSGL